VQLLLDRCEERVQVDVQEAEEVGMGGISHKFTKLIVFAFFSLLG